MTALMPSGAGVAMPEAPLTTGPRVPPPWSARDDDRLRFLVRQGWSVVRIAGTLGRSVKSCYDRAAALFGGIDRERHQLFTVRSAREVAALMGVSHHRVARWATGKILKATRNHSRCGRRAKNRQFLITDQHLEAFISDRKTWMLWDAEAITDPDWRQYAEQARAARPGRWVPTGAVGAQAVVGTPTVRAWCREGRLVEAEVVKVAGRYWLWQADPQRASAGD